MADPGWDVEFIWASERHLRLGFGAADSRDVHARVHQALAAIQKVPPHGLVDTTPSYSTILLEFDGGSLDELRAVDGVRRALADAGDAAEGSPAPVVEIPVCYEPPFAPDAEDVARLHGIDIPALIRLHTQPLYIVQFIGFSPGFPYLSGLPKELATPRLAVPRVRVPRGSVGIAGPQTGIYPTETAGGWRLIGRTPVTLFDASRETPALLKAGDPVRFLPIGASEFTERLRGMPGHE